MAFDLLVYVCMGAGVLPPNCHPFRAGTCSCQVHEMISFLLCIAPFSAHIFCMCGRKRA